MAFQVPSARPSSLQYFELKTAMLEFDQARAALIRRLEAEHQAALQAAVTDGVKQLLQKRDAAVTAAGLDPSKDYVLVEATKTVIEAPRSQTG